MSKYFSIDGYWKGNKSEFYDYIVKEYDDSEGDEELDDLIFYFGMGENEIEDAIAMGENTTDEFVITSYKEITL